MKLLVLASCLAAGLLLLRFWPTRAPRLEERPRVPEDVYVLSLWERAIDDMRHEPPRLLQ